MRARECPVYSTAVPRALVIGDSTSYGVAKGLADSTIAPFEVEWAGRRNCPIARMEAIRWLTGDQFSMADCPSVAALWPREIADFRPDVIVEWQDGDYVVRLINDVLPKVGVSHQVKSLLREARGDPKLREHLKRKVDLAKWLIEAIAQRQNTLERVAKEIVSRQRDYFDLGVSHLRPLKMQEVADGLGGAQDAAAEASRDVMRARAELDALDTDIAAQSALVSEHDMRITALRGSAEAAESALAAVRAAVERQQRALDAALARRADAEETLAGVDPDLVPEGSAVANYGFDVTPARLVTALITERGVLQPAREALAAAFPERAALRAAAE